jgi:hypothetical protein
MEIQLNDGLIAIIDDGDWPKVSQHKWFAGTPNKQGNRYVRAYDKSKYVPKLRKQKFISLHRLIMDAYDRSILVDHINHDTLDNRRSNLRLATQQENQRNRKCAAKNSSSKYIGVFKREFKTKTSWRAGIKYNKKMLWLGHFDREEDASKAYNEAALKYFGEFASLNQ